MSFFLFFTSQSKSQIVDGGFSILSTTTDGIEIEVFAAFSFGYGPTCPELDSAIYYLDNNVLYINTYYDVSGYWPAAFCTRIDTLLLSHTEFSSVILCSNATSDTTLSSPPEYVVVQEEAECDTLTLQSTSVVELSVNRKLLRIVDLLGRETPEKKKTPLFYIYDDGTIEKRVIIE
ncbi:MAG: hypothetical protein H8D62_03005 [Bacteroidetes bacterium]|nr:hypothetical protein [Bacteroidota bacterium]